LKLLVRDNPMCDLTFKVTLTVTVGAYSDGDSLKLTAHDSPKIIRKANNEG